MKELMVLLIAVCMGVVFGILIATDSLLTDYCEIQHSAEYLVIDPLGSVCLDPETEEIFKIEWIE